MAMTMTQKILAAHAGLADVVPGQLIEVPIDLALANDVTAPVTIRVMRESGFDRVWDRERACLVMDHFVPNKDIKSAENCKLCRDFARAHDLEHFFDVGSMGIEHALLPEQGLVTAGDIVIGADSHTCTYGALGAFSTGMGSTDLAAGMACGRTWLRVPGAIRVWLTGELGPWVSGKDVILWIIGKIGVDGALYQSMEFCGPGVASLSMDERFTICNMGVEAGAKNAIFPVDDATRAYMEGRVRRPPVEFAADDDASYERTIEVDLGTIAPTVAVPHLPENARPAAELAGVELDQCVIGSCTNGRIEDMRVAARVLEGHHVHPRVRTIVIPATQDVYLQCVSEGLAEIFVRAGAAFSTPTCGPCLGGHMGILAAGERAIATTNRNFVGRMGHVDSEVYLASPAVAAASAIAGHIAVPPAPVSRRPRTADALRTTPLPARPKPG
ncbi:MAG: 3-isopropylmalate dehydratase large subunit [Eggerthellaceae bacterium]|nr:3-isopropylmalate dehydratase large subunit [Eggerthellaceae bacterium]